MRENEVERVCLLFLWVWVWVLEPKFLTGRYKHKQHYYNAALGISATIITHPEFITYRT